MESNQDQLPDSIKGHILINLEPEEITDWDERWRTQLAEDTIKMYARVAALDSCNESLISFYTDTLKKFHSTWKKQNTQVLNFENEVIHFSREFRKLIKAFPDDSAELADAFCLNIRYIILEMTDTFIRRWTSSYKGIQTPQVDISAPGATEILKKWMAELRREEEAAISELLYGPYPILPPLEGEIYTSTYKEALRKLAFRHQFHATISLYQYVRELYEKHLPKQFARRVNLPAFYIVPPATSRVLPEKPELLESSQSNNIIPPSTLSAEELKAIAIKASLVSNDTNSKTKGTTASAIWGMVELLDAANLIFAGNKCKMAIYLANQYNVKMRHDYDGPNGFPKARTNAWRLTGLALVELAHFSEKQREIAMTELNNKKNNKRSKKMG